MKIISKDITTIEEGIICHQVNTQGVMGSGLALQIKRKFPVAFTEYKRFCDTLTDKELLGAVAMVMITEKLVVANLFGQTSYGRQGIHTNYGALQNALEQVIEAAEFNGDQVYVPYNLGCGLAGGNWLTVSKMIEKLEALYETEIIVCRLQGL